MPNWRSVLASELEKPYFAELNAFVATERQQTEVYPSQEHVLAALRVTPLEAVRVVILGQDPYHGGQAHGLAFSVTEDSAIPPSLHNIYKELSADIPGFAVPLHGNLTAWAERGVLLLNTVLTVRAHQAGSHRGKGWETFTGEIIAQVAAAGRPIVFVLWGADARKKKPLIETAGRGRHLVIESAHPSPLSAHAGFLGSRPFSRANAFLQASGQAPIDWTIPNPSS